MSSPEPDYHIVTTDKPASRTARRKSPAQKIRSSTKGPNDDVVAAPTGAGADMDEPLVDHTEALALHSKRTERQRRKLAKKSLAPSPPATSRLLNLPCELLLEILCTLPPSALFTLLRVCKFLRAFILSEQRYIAKHIISLRYACLAKSFPLPVPIEAVPPALQARLQHTTRTDFMATQRPYQLVQPANPSVTCTCHACILRWNCLCIAVDFAHWQDNLDSGEPIPMFPRGMSPKWNRTLNAHVAAVVLKCIRSPLWYARVLEAHLVSTTRSIRRHGLNKGNKRRRFRMTEEDVRAGTADFLERSGPPTSEIPYHRDNYYLLEAFVPHRSWIKGEEQWVYAPADQHERDLDMMFNGDAGRKMNRAEGQAVDPQSDTRL
ncbi:hypothetical protein B0T19DRAFT_240882 [Cercophora scortea]|uniref:F-box domain-containing protein n=1 Tax=Cercophora scortea TaxID=314031 RepID=A0AAE0I9B6_9PEZI|nr:hypothetical protein B0T19DRAFT_240882 [Cercophora scortea]